MSERDFATCIRILARQKVRCLIIGGYAMAHHGLIRATNDVGDDAGGVFADDQRWGVRATARQLRGGLGQRKLGEDA